MAGLIAWTGDVFPDQADRARFPDVAMRVVAAVQEVTGYSADLGSWGPYGRSLLASA